VEAAKIMASKPAEFTGIIVKDKLSGYEMDVLKGTPPSVSHPGTVNGTYNLDGSYKVKNNTGSAALIRVESEVLGYKVGGSIVVNAGEECTFSYPQILPSNSAGRYPQPCTFRTYVVGRETEAHEVKATVYEGWFLATHAFMFGTEPDGENLDTLCRTDVSGKIWSSPDGHLHFFGRGITATVEAKPRYPWEHAYWIIGGTKRTDNPASFIMTYNNFAYAYLCAPTPRFRALEDVTGDGYVGGDDIVMVAKHFGTRPGDPNWDPRYDLNGNGYVGSDDILRVAKAFGSGNRDMPGVLTVALPTQVAAQSMVASGMYLAVGAATVVILSAFLKSIIRSLRR
jgi:hypothetical protein